VNITDGTNSSTATFYDNRTEFSDPILTPDGGPTAPAVAPSGNPDQGLFFLAGPSTYLQNQGSGTQTSRSVLGLLAESAQLYSQSSGDAAKRTQITFEDTGSDVMRGEWQTDSASTTYFGLRILAQSGSFYFNTGGAGEEDILQLGTSGVTICDESDDTKCVNHDVSSVTTATTRTASWHDESGYVTQHQQGTSTLTDSAATSVLSFPLADEEQVAGTYTSVTECRNASNWVVQHDTFDFVCLNQADTETCSSQSTPGTPPEVNDGAGTFTSHALTFSYGTNQVTFQINSNCSLTTQTLHEELWEIEFHHGSDWQVVTEQN
jgi:hypothetical protein